MCYDLKLALLLIKVVLQTKKVCNKFVIRKIDSEVKIWLKILFNGLSINTTTG